MADASNAFKTKRISNLCDATVSRADYTTVVEDGITTETVRVKNVKLHALMYDATLISIDDVPELELWREDALSRCWLSVNEFAGEKRSVTFNMSTRLDREGNPVSMSVFYEDKLRYNSEERRYELSIFVPARCTNGVIDDGFDDSYVIFECVAPGEDNFFSITGQYTTALPPLIVQGKASKRNQDEGDPVFPKTADRCDIGVDTIPCYYENSQGYTKDYLFTNAEPKYHILTSGLVPASMAGQVEFDSVSGYLLDEKTGSINQLQTEEIESFNKSLDVMTNLDSISVPFTGDFEVTVWDTDIDSEWAKNEKSSSKNIVTVSAELHRL